MTDAASSGVGLILLAILAALAVVTLGPALGDVINTLPSLEWTKHAESSHSKEIWNVSSILPLISSSGCHPIVMHECPAVNLRKIICPLGGSELWVGLILSTTTNRIITGYPAPLDYWQNAAIRDSCIQAALP